jgi:hypothetical protein
VDGHTIIEFIDSLGFAEETLADLVGIATVEGLGLSSRHAR